MAKRVSLKQRIYDRVPDWIWPHVTGEKECEPEDQSHFNAEHARLIDEISPILSFRLAQAEERSKTVDSKLVSMLTFTSALTAVVAGSLAAALTIYGAQSEKMACPMIVAGTVVGFFALLVVYVSIQLLRSLLATSSGLRRRWYRQLSPKDIVPNDCESREMYRIRIMNYQVNGMRQNEWTVSRKVDDMEVAYIALRNALPAAFVLIVMSIVIASVRLGYW